MGTTPKGYPFPEGTDLVVDGDDAIEALAEKIDEKVPFAFAMGSASAGTVGEDSIKNVTVTFPAGRFTTAPIVAALNIGNTPHLRYLTSQNRSTTSMTLSFYNTGASRSMSATWIAMQMAAASALLVADEPAATATCPTPGCGNAGQAIPVVTTVPGDDGTAVPVDLIECGVCGTELTAEGA